MLGSRKAEVGLDLTAGAEYNEEGAPEGSDCEEDGAMLSLESMPCSICSRALKV